MQSGQRYTQRHCAVGGTLRPSNGAPSVVSAQFKGVPCSALRYHPSTDLSRLPTRARAVAREGPHRAKPWARGTHLGDIEAALA